MASFRENKSLSDTKVIQEKLGDANRNLEVIRRQVLLHFKVSSFCLIINCFNLKCQVMIGHMFEPERLVIEKM